MKRSLSIIGGESSKACDSAGHSLLEPRFNVTTAAAYRGNAAIVTLGCAKNHVDSEVMLGVLESSGFEIVNDVTAADVVVVNTCGFLESAIKESIDAVLDVSSLKKTGRLRKLVVAGCMVERYKGDLAASLPEADAFLTTDELLKVGAAANGEFSSLLDSAARPYFLYDDAMPRHLASGRHFAYVKISEGCNRPCTFCAIPSIRGKMRSRAPQSVLREIASLRDAGVKEINLIGQDLTAYGDDLKDDTDLPTLLRMIEKESRNGIPWIRLLYTYPLGINEDLLNAIVESESVANYLDLPLQHSSESVLSRMKRPLGKFAPRKLIPFIRDKAPQISLRTTFIVGFPGETEKDIEDLEDFVREGHFTHVGVFTYSKEEGTPSFELDGHISEKVKKERRERIMSAQQEVVGDRNEDSVGETLEVLIEGTHPDTDLLYTGRSRFQAPEVDGCVIINDSDGPINVGEIATVMITEVAGYDLVGKAIAKAESISPSGASLV